MSLHRAAMTGAWKIFRKIPTRLYHSLMTATILPCTRVVTAVPQIILCYSNDVTAKLAADQKVAMSDRILNAIARMSGFYSRESILSRSAYSIYKNTFDELNYEKFFEVCKLPDSMHSWFLIAQLHMWLLMVRLKREGNDGEFLIKQLVEVFWEDAKQRPRKLGVHSGSLIDKTLNEWSEMFKGLILAYEEGLLLSDRVLAGAIWRNLIGDKNAIDPVDLEVMVHYIRYQVTHMDSLDSQSLLSEGNIKLLPLDLHISTQ